MRYIKNMLKSFLQGMAHTLDLGSTLSSHNIDNRPWWEKDAEALHSDWEAIGNDIRTVFQKYQEKD